MSDIRVLIVEHIQHLRRYARVLLGDPDSADDLVQECLLRAIDRSHTWRPGTNMRAWLFTILHNLFIDGKRRIASRPRLVSVDGHDARMVQIPNQADSIELSNLEAALHTLPDDQRVTVLLVGLEGLTYEEASSIMGVPVGTVRSRLSRGRETLRQAMDGDRLQRACTGGDGG